MMSVRGYITIYDRHMPEFIAIEEVNTIYNSMH